MFSVWKNAGFPLGLTTNEPKWVTGEPGELDKDSPKVRQTNQVSDCAMRFRSRFPNRECVDVERKLYVKMCVNK